MDKIRIIEELYSYQEYLKVKKAVVEHVFKNGTKNVYSRFKLDRPDAVVVLIYNQDTGNVILTKQFRYPIFDREDSFIIEAVAGKIDGYESPKTAAVREVMEEVGYEVKEERLVGPISIYPSPGYTNEKIYMFLSIVKEENKIENKGGGLETENEEIEIIEVPLEEFKTMIENNEIMDAKTILSANLLLNFTFKA